MAVYVTRKAALAEADRIGARSVREHDVLANGQVRYVVSEIAEADRACICGACQDRGTCAGCTCGVCP